MQCPQCGRQHPWHNRGDYCSRECARLGPSDDLRFSEEEKDKVRASYDLMMPGTVIQLDMSE